MSGLLVKRSKSGILGKKLLQTSSGPELDRIVLWLERQGYASSIDGEPPFQTEELAIVMNAALSSSSTEELAALLQTAEREGKRGWDAF